MSTNPEELRTVGITFATGSLPIDLTLFAVSVSPGIPQRSLAAIQAGAGPVNGLACVLDQSKRVISSNLSALPVSTTPRVGLLLQGVEPAFSLVRYPLPLVRETFALVRQMFALVGAMVAIVRQMFALVGAMVAIVRKAITPESSVVRRGHVLRPPWLVRGNRVGRSHAPTVRSTFALQHLHQPSSDP